MWRAGEPQISLCMIARNEERFLGDCLASVADVCREAIVVDTGSDDRTMEIARRAGARVIESPWTDDFAAARNVGIEAAQGTHVLVLDADERLAPRMGPNLVRGARSTDLLLGCLPLYNASTFDATMDEVLDGDKRLGDPVFVPRLFKNLPEMRFRRRVHETLSQGFNELHVRGEGQTVAVGAALVHYGDVPSHRVQQAKDERNVLLLRRGLQDDPADGELAGYLVVELIKAGRPEEAREVGERHFPLFLERNENRPPGWFPENMVRIGYSLGLVQVSAGAYEDAREVVRASRKHTPDGHPNLDYVEALAEMGLRNWEPARALFDRVIEAHGRGYAQPVLQHITNEMSRLKLAGIALECGELDRVRECLPPGEGIWRFAVELVLAELDLAEGRPNDAMERLSTFVDQPGLAPDWHVLVHRALEAMGRETENLLELAAGAERSAWLEPRRAKAIR